MLSSSVCINHTMIKQITPATWMSVFVIYDYTSCSIKLHSILKFKRCLQVLEYQIIKQTFDQVSETIMIILFLWKFSIKLVKIFVIFEVGLGWYFTLIP